MRFTAWVFMKLVSGYQHNALISYIEFDHLCNITIGLCVISHWILSDVRKGFVLILINPLTKLYGSSIFNFDTTWR
jgi:hypothetical protein